MTQNPSILVIEDDDDSRALLLSSLIDAGFPALGVRDAGSALKALRAVSYDVVLSDLMMPGQSGLDLLRIVRDLDLPVEFIFLTAFASQKLAIEAMRLSAVDLLEKPASFSRIEEALRRAMARREKRRKVETRTEDLERLERERSRVQEVKMRVLAQALDGASKSGSVLEALSDLREYLRVEGGELRSAAESILTESLMELCVSEAARLDPDAARRIETRPAIGVASPLRLDAHRLAALASRLMVNSCRAASRGPVSIDLAVKDRDLVLTVSDGGDPPPRDIASAPPFHSLDRLASWSRAEGAELPCLLCVAAMARDLRAWVSVGPTSEGPAGHSGTRWEVRVPNALGPP